MKTSDGSSGDNPIPRLVVLTSSSVNPTVIDRAFSQAEWLRTVYVQPGLLMERPAGGYQLSTARVDRLVSYGVLAKAMLEVALVDDFDGAGVAVIAEDPGSVRKDVTLLVRRVVTGFGAHYFPVLIRCVGVRPSHTWNPPDPLLSLLQGRGLFWLTSLLGSINEDSR